MIKVKKTPMMMMEMTMTTTQLNWQTTAMRKVV